MKKLFALLLTLVMVLSLAACGAKKDTAPADKPVETPVETPVDAPAEEKVITIGYWVPDETEWNAQVLADTGIRIEYEQIDSANYADIMTTRVKGGTAPDIFYGYNQDCVDMYIEGGYVVELTDYVDGYVADWIVEGTKNRYDGKVWGFRDQTGYGEVMFWNKDIFAECGIDQFPQNMDEFIAVCETLKENGYVPFIHGDSEMNHLKRTPFEPINIIHRNEGGVDWINGLPTGESKFTDEEFVKAAGYFQACVDNGYMHDLSNSITHVEAWELFCQGEAAMMTGASFYSDQNYALMQPEFDMGTGPIPYNYTGVPTTSANATDSVVFFANANSDNQEVIMEYVEYYITHLKDNANLTGRPMAYQPKEGEVSDWASFAWMFDEWAKHPATLGLRQTSLIQKDLEAWEQGVLTGSASADMSYLEDLQSKLDAAIG